jgi:hypothetical protein
LESTSSEISSSLSLEELRLLLLLVKLRLLLLLLRLRIAGLLRYLVLRLIALLALRLLSQVTVVHSWERVLFYGEKREVEGFGRTKVWN